MRGHIVRRGDSTWRLHVYGGRDPVTRKPRQHTKTVRGTKGEAESALHRFIVEVEEGRARVAAGTFGDLLERWISTQSASWSPSRQHAVRWTADAYLHPQLGPFPVVKITSETLDLFYARVRRAGVGGRPLSASSVRHIHQMVHRCLEMGVKWGWLAANPAGAATPPSAEASDLRVPSVDDVQRLIQATMTTDLVFGALVVLLATAGCRRGEALALCWADLDLDDAQVTIHRSVGVTPAHGLQFKSPKSKKSRRVSLGAGTIEALRAVRAQAEEFATVGHLSVRPKHFVFALPPWEEPWHPDSVTQRWGRLCAREGVAGVRLHDLRHFSATHLLGAGVGVGAVADRLGHTSAKMTLDVYRHFLPAADRRAADVIDGIVGGTESK